MSLVLVLYFSPSLDAIWLLKKYHWYPFWHEWWWLSKWHVYSKLHLSIPDPTNHYVVVFKIPIGKRTLPMSKSYFFSPNLTSPLFTCISVLQTKTKFASQLTNLKPKYHKWLHHTHIFKNGQDKNSQKLLKDH